MVVVPVPTRLFTLMSPAGVLVCSSLALFS